MSTCASKSCCAPKPVSLKLALSLGWRFLRGKLWCPRCYAQEVEG